MRDLKGLRVCFVAGTLGQGGAERQLYYMLSVLKEKGAIPRVLSLTTGEHWEERIKALGVPVTWVGQTHSRFRRLRAIIKELRREPADILQSQHFYTNIYVVAAARVLGIVEIGALRSDAINEVGANSGPLGWLSLRAPGAVAANSRQAIDNAVSLGMSRNRLNFLPNVVDTSHFAPDPTQRPGAVRVLTIGRIAPQKRFDRFLRVIAAVRQRSPDEVCGVLVGDGPGRSTLEDDARQIGLPSTGIEFHGLKADVASFYHDSDVFVLTSDWEGTPNVVLEAMASGLPVVATRVGGVAALIRDGETGFLADAEDETALVKAVLELVQNREKRLAFGKRAREFVENQYALPKLADELLQLYDRVLRSAHSRNQTSSIGALSVQRLAVVTSVIHYRYGGRIWAYGPYVLEIDAWAKMFPEILVAAPCRNSSPPDDCLPLPQNVSIVPQREMGGTNLSAKLAQLVALPYAIYRLCFAIRQADAVHVRCPGNVGLMGALISPLLQRKRIAKFAGQWTDYDQEPWTVRLQRRILRSRWWNAPVLVYTDRKTERDFVVPSFAYGLTASQVARGRAASILRGANAPLHVLYAGRLSPAKNVDTLLEAVAMVRRKGVPMTCTIVGEGPERSNLEHQAESLDIRSSVRFAGGATPAEVLLSFEAADILVLASDTEGWPKALVEGMAFGLVCIGSTHGLMPRMLGEGRGLVVPPRNASALAEALHTANQMSQNELTGMRERAVAWAGNFTVEEFERSLQGVLERHWGIRPTYLRLPGLTSTAPPRRVGVMHLTDTLEIGGAERMAVSLANSLSRTRFAPHLCTTRRGGPLEDIVASDVGQLALNRSKTMDVRALWRLVSYIREHDIQILHAHGTAVFIAAGASLFRPNAKVVWHIHYGRHAAEHSSGWQYRTIRSRIQRSIAVSEALASWASRIIGMPPKNVTYIPNFSSASGTVSSNGSLNLPGRPGSRIVCVANFLPEKDHLTLIAAMERVIQKQPNAHLLLVGGGRNSEWGRAVTYRIKLAGIEGNVSMLGQRRDVMEILRSADIGVLSSMVEGLPLALIEYGEAGLPVVVTSVGQCGDVVDHGNAGLAVPPRQPDQMAAALLQLLQSPAERSTLGHALRRRVHESFNPSKCVESVYATYDQLMTPNGA
jgi:glycosyltransferase involved in cell wall biosynthesis